MLSCRRNAAALHRQTSGRTHKLFEIPFHSRIMVGIFEVEVPRQLPCVSHGRVEAE